MAHRNAVFNFPAIKWWIFPVRYVRLPVAIPWRFSAGATPVTAQEARQQLPDVALGLWPGASEAEPYDEMREAKGAESHRRL